MRENVLDRYPSAHIQVLVVWFDMLPGDTRALTDLQVLNDRRVANFWDEKKTVGRWYGDHLGGGGITWDAYFLYGPNARWSDASTELLGRGGPVIAARDDLHAALRSFLERRSSSRRIFGAQAPHLAALLLRSSFTYQRIGSLRSSAQDHDLGHLDTESLAAYLTDVPGP